MDGRPAAAAEARCPIVDDDGGWCVQTLDCVRRSTSTYKSVDVTRVTNTHTWRNDIFKNFDYSGVPR